MNEINRDDRAEFVVIIGAGQAGGRAAEALRQGGYEGPVIVVGDEKHPPYERPSLSKEFLHEGDAGKIAWIRPHEWWAANGIDLLPSRRAAKIDRRARRVLLDDGTSLSYRAVVIATGTRPRPLPVEGADHPSVHYLRTIDDSARLREFIRPGGRLVVIGAGFIGLEVAATVRKLGGDVTVIELGALPMARGVPAAVGAFYADFHRSQGVDLRFGASVTQIHNRNGVTDVELTDGTFLSADAVVVGIGVIPNAELAIDAGLKVDNGIVVDAYGRTDDPLIYAAGDVTSHFNPLLGRTIRLESWQNAQNQAIAVARNILGQSKVYAEVPWFWSDQFGRNLQIAGTPETNDTIVSRGSLGEGPVAMFHLREGRLVAAIGLDSPREVRFARDIIALGGEISVTDLANPAVNLMTVARAMKEAAKDMTKA